MKPNPTAYAQKPMPRLGKPGRNAHSGEETACPWSPAKEISMAGEDFTGLP